MSTSQGSSKVGSKLGLGLLAAVAGCTLAGCGVGATTDLKKGFLDPTAVGRYQRQPLVIPILGSLDRSVDPGDDRFSKATDVTAEDLNPSSTDYTIGKNDLVTIAITDLVSPNVETVRTPRVSESGMVSLPLIGQIKAEGLTEAQLEAEITKAYRQANVIQNAQVSVSVSEARARTFSILGSVTTPGQYAILNSEFRVLDALVLARDVNSLGVDNIYIVRQLDKQAAPTTTPQTPAAPDPLEDDVLTPRGDAGARKVIRAQAAVTTEAAPEATADDQRFITVDGNQVTVDAPQPEATPTPIEVTIEDTQEAPADAPAAEVVADATATAPDQGEFEFRDPVAEGKTRIIRIPYEALRNGDLRYNIVVKPYDLIIVPNPIAGEYYMGGHVQRVGVYTLTARKITLKQAIVSAGMFDQLAVPAQTDVIRRVGQDREIFVKVDLDKVFAGEQPDIFLRPNDVVQVGTSWWAPFVASLRGGFRMTYGFGFLYDRNWGDPEERRL